MLMLRHSFTAKIDQCALNSNRNKDQMMLKSARWFYFSLFKSLIMRCNLLSLQFFLIITSLFLFTVNFRKTYCFIVLLHSQCIFSLINTKMINLCVCVCFLLLFALFDASPSPLISSPSPSFSSINTHFYVYFFFRIKEKQKK